MHQPSYRGPIYNKIKMLDMPWVRLHASHAYYDLLLGLKEKPAIKMVFNYSGILLDQIMESAAAIARGDSPDYHHFLSAKDPDKLSQSEISQMRKTFFFGNRSTMIDPYPRYHELMDKSNRGEEFTFQEILDLQVLANLAWIGPFTRESDTFLEDMVSQGRDFSLSQKKRVLDIQGQALTKLVPTLKELQDAGQIEISVTPHYHPILPMLIDSNVADAKALRPVPPFAFKEDAITQVRKAREIAGSVFGRAPVGMWPSEGAVSKQAMKTIFSQGIRWAMASDVVLERSLERSPTITEQYYPWSYENGHLFFRDSRLSNAISFKYNNWDSAFNAAQEIIINLLGIMGVHKWAFSPLVPIMLDGENPWEHYKNKTFFRELLNALDHHQQYSGLETTTPSRYLEELEGAELNPLPKLVPGTWADGASFTTWLGNDLTKRMWEALRAARSAVEEYACCGQFGEEFDSKVAQAKEILMAAEGSDTFWWAGPHHDTPQRPQFDEIFREKLRQVYRIIGKAVPDYLDIPFLDVPKVLIDVRSRIADEPIISVDPASKKVDLPRIGGKIRSLVLDQGTGLASLVEFTREPRGERMILSGKEEPVQPIIHRTDPLGRDVTTVISLFRSQRPQPKVPPMREQGSKECVFCDLDKVAGPLVIADLAYSGKNRFAFLDYHEVIPHARHIEFMKDIRRSDVEDVTEVLHSRIMSILGQEGFNRIIAGWNFGGGAKPWSSGASIEHLHMQLGFIVDPLLIQPDPTAETVAAYRSELGADLFDNYYTALKRAKLVIWEDKNFVVYTPFAPKFKDQVEIFSKDPQISGLIDTTPSTRASLYDAMFLTVRGLKELRVPVTPGNESATVNAGIESFNANFFQRDRNDERPGQRMWVEFEPRQSQIAFAEIRQMFVVDRKPEDTARFMRVSLRDSSNPDIERILAESPIQD